MMVGIFKSVLASSQDITDGFFTLDPKRIIQASDHEFDDKVTALAREIMFGELAHGTLNALEITPTIMDWVNSGAIVAIDGTVAADMQGKGACDAIAMAVGTVAGRQPFHTSISITRVQASLFDKLDNPETLVELVESLSEIHDDQSWPTTYREYLERTIGMEATGFEARLFDGPLITQNLATQSEAHELLERVVDGEGCINLGVIKDTRRADPFTRLAGMALQEGEYVVLPLRLALDQRTKNAIGKSSPLQEINHSFGTKVVRVVFRPTERSFAIEVRKNQWRDAMGIVLASAAKQRGMELPYQLLAVDARLRRLFASAEENGRRILAADPRGLRWLSERTER